MLVAIIYMPVAIDYIPVAIRHSIEHPAILCYDKCIAAAHAATMTAPEWIHFGAGNIFRALIATGTSQKLAISFGETIKACQRRPDLDVRDLKIIPLAFAGWLRYALGVDDRGEAFTPSDDPVLPEVQRALSGIRLGDRGPFTEALRPMRSNDHIFGVNLCEGYFEELAAGPGAVRATLAKYLD